MLFYKTKKNFVFKFVFKLVNQNNFNIVSVEFSRPTKEPIILKLIDNLNILISEKKSEIFCNQNLCDYAILSFKFINLIYQ